MIKYIFILLLFSNCYSQKQPIESKQRVEKYLISKKVKESIIRRVDNGSNTGIVIGVLDSIGSEFYSYGVKSLNSIDSVNENTIFEIGSITKTFTGIMYANLVVKGKLKLNTPLQDILPKGITAPILNGDSIKLVQLINHTSGLPGMPSNFAPENPANPLADYSNKQMYEFINNYQLTRAIGTEYEYSNIAVGLLGQLIATINKSTFEEMMIRIIAKPLKLKNTRIILTPGMREMLALGDNNGEQVQNWDFMSLEGAGAIKSNAIDMMKYLSANMELTKTELIPALRLSHTNTRPIDSNPLVGLAWHILKIEDSEIIWHNGGTAGYRTYIGFDKKKRKGVIVLSNSAVSIDDIGIHILNSNTPMNN